MDTEMVLEATLYASGHPLALKVLGSFLCSRSQKEWESALMRLKRFPNPEIQDVLRISYEGLDDKKMKDTFLDIACLFNSCFTRDQVESILDDRNSSVKIEISVLIDKCLVENIKGHGDNKLWMHDLLREMGRAIVCDEDNEPGNRSRLWDTMEVCEVLENSTGTMAVEVISLDMSKMKRNVTVCRGAFSNMRNLRILKIYYFDDIVGNSCKRNIIGGVEFELSIPRDLDAYLSNKIRFFQWDLYPLKSLPSNFIPENLVELVLRGSNIEKLWNNCKVQSLTVLRRINLSSSKFLTQLPELSQCLNLESINLEGCTRMVQVLSSLQNLEKLTYLNLSGCSKLRDLEEISKRTEGYLDVARLGVIKNLLKSFTYLKRCIQTFTGNLCLYPSQDHISQKFAPNLTSLLLRETAIETVPPSICYLWGLVELDLSDCNRLKSLPTSICHLKSLESLILDSCEKLKTFPEILEPMENLRDLYLSSTGIEDLPESIENLVSLQILCLVRCKDLEFLPSSLCNLRNLSMIHLCLSSKIQKLPSLPPSLLRLWVDHCERLKSLPELPWRCSNLSASGCTSLENISNWRAPLLFDHLAYAMRLNDSINFHGCEKLDHKTHNTTIADHAVIHILARIKFGRESICYKFCYPGDEIPKWFNHQTCGTSINNIMLPPYWNNDDFLALAFCIVFHWNKIGNIFESKAGCELNFKTIDDGSLYKYHKYHSFLSSNDNISLDHNYIRPDHNYISSDHVLIWYVERQSLESAKEMDGLDWPSTCSTEASFHFYTTYGFLKKVIDYECKYAEIKKIGVRFVYEQDMERCYAETKRKNKRSFNESCQSRGSEAVGSLEEEDDDESHSKKLKLI